MKSFWQPRNLFWVLVFFGLTLANSAFAKETESLTLVEKITGWIADLVTKLAQIVGQWVVLMIGGVIIPIIQYNDFVNSPAVGAGWSVVRDVINMFFVIIFIAIAFGTILGMDKFKWRQQIPRLLLIAIFINFSRTLCGLMIDFSQVFMLTFVNAVKDIAGGNFIQMFGLTDIMNSGDSQALYGSGGSGLTNFDLLSAAIAALLMMLIVFVTLLFFAIALAYRIVLLWVLVTMAPLAWFFKGTEGILKTSKDPYSTWWSKFNCALQLGPILTFFLWLALAVAGSGNLSESSGFFENSSTLDAGVLLKALSPAKLVSFIIGILILFAGLDAANDACASSDGVMSGLMKKAKGASSAIVKAPVGLAGGAALLAGRAGMAVGKAGAQKAYKETLGRGVSAARNVGTDVASSLSSSGSRLPGFMKRPLSKLAAKGKAARAADAEMEAKTPMGNEELLSYVGDGIGVSKGGRDEYMGRMRQVLTDESLRNKLGPKKLREFIEAKDPLTGKKVGDMVQETYSGDAGFQKQLLEMKKKSPALFGEANLKEKIKERKDVEGVDRSQWEDAGFRKHLEGMDYSYVDANGQLQTEVDDGKGGREKITMAEAAKRGYLGTGIKSFYEEGGEKISKQQRFDVNNAKPIRDLNVDDIGEGQLQAPLAAKILATGSERQIEALKKRKDYKPEEHLTAALGLAGKDEKKRRGLRSMMLKEGVGVRKAFGFDEQNGGFGDDAQAEADFAAAVNSDPEVLSQAMADKDLQPHAARHVSTRSVGRMLSGLGSKKTLDEREKESERLAGLFEQVEAQLKDVEGRIETAEKNSGRGGAEKLVEEEEKRLEGLKKQIDLLEGQDKPVPEELRTNFASSSSTLTGLKRNLASIPKASVPQDWLAEKQRLEQVLKQKEEVFKPQVEAIKFEKDEAAQAASVQQRPSRGVDQGSMAALRVLTDARNKIKNNLDLLKGRMAEAALNLEGKSEIERIREASEGRGQIEDMEKQMAAIEAQMQNVLKASGKKKE